MISVYLVLEKNEVARTSRCGLSLQAVCKRTGNDEKCLDYISGDTESDRIF